MKTFADPVLCARPSGLERSDDPDDDVPSGDIELLDRLRAGDGDPEGDDHAALMRWRECDVEELDVDADGDLELLAQLRERDWIGV